MRNKIREKIVASVMLSAFAITNSMSATFAMDNVFDVFFNFCAIFS